LYIAFILTNAVFLLFEDSTWTYFFISLASSLLYILVAGSLVSLLIRVLKIRGSGESAMIFVSIIYHPVILLLMIFVKWIIRSV
jgi:cation transporter-like permease